MDKGERFHDPGVLSYNHKILSKEFLKQCYRSDRNQEGQKQMKAKGKCHKIKSEMKAIHVQKSET